MQRGQSTVKMQSSSSWLMGRWERWWSPGKAQGTGEGTRCGIRGKKHLEMVNTCLLFNHDWSGTPGSVLAMAWLCLCRSSPSVLSLSKPCTTLSLSLSWYNLCIIGLLTNIINLNAKNCNEFFLTFPQWLPCSYGKELCVNKDQFITPGKACTHTEPISARDSRKWTFYFSHWCILFVLTTFIF